MKILYALLVSLFTFQTQASWNKIIECDNGEFVIDTGEKDPLGRPSYQLVLRGQPLNSFIQQGAVDPKDLNDRGEFVTVLNTYDSQFMGSRFYGTAANGMQIYRNYWISRQNGEISIRVTIGNRYLGEKETANWQFHNCHIKY